MPETILYERFKTVPLSQFHPELRFEFKDLPEALFDFAIIRTARMMAKDGSLIRRRIAISLQPNVRNYRLDSPDGLEVCSILKIRYSSLPFARSFVPPPDCCTCDARSIWFDDIENELRLNYSPPLPGVLYVTAAVCPADNACELPEEFYTEYVDLLMSGIRARILSIDNRPWTNIQLGAVHARAFNEGLAAAAIDANTHKMRGTIKINWGKIL